jgi:hypothetical protein
MIAWKLTRLNRNLIIPRGFGEPGERDDQVEKGIFGEWREPAHSFSRKVTLTDPSPLSELSTDRGDG